MLCAIVHCIMWLPYIVNNTRWNPMYRNLTYFFPWFAELALRVVTVLDATNTILALPMGCKCFPRFFDNATFPTR